MENKLIEKILNNKDLCKYLDEGDWINFWVNLPEVLLEGGVDPHTNIPMSEMKEFKELIPQAFDLVKITRKYDSHWFVCEDDDQAWGYFLTTDKIPDLKFKSSDWVAYFFDKNVCLKFADTIGAKIEEEIDVDDDYHIYLNISNNPEMPVYIFCFYILK